MSTNDIPQSHQSVIQQTWRSRQPHDTKETICKKRIHTAGNILLLKNKSGVLKTMNSNYNKKTYCYKMITGDGISYFVKIFEDSKAKPTKISKKLFTDTTLKCKMAPYLLIPAFKPQKTPLDGHMYEVVMYPFIKHCNLQDITLKALRQGYIEPDYHKSVPSKEPHGPGYKLRMLKKFKRCINIAICMKDEGNGYVDMDISPDNFIITTDIDDAADNDDIDWATITDANNAKLIKIDHESMMKWEEKFDYVEKPMKDEFKPPEVNKTLNDQFISFDVEKANVYQYGATFVYVLYGKMKHVDENGIAHWKSLPDRGEGEWKDTNWTPKLIDIQWLRGCLDSRPHMRPTYDQLLKCIVKELSTLEPTDSSRSINNIGSFSSHRNRPNNFNSPHSQRNNAYIIFNPKNIQNMQHKHKLNENQSLQRRRMMQMGIKQQHFNQNNNLRPHHQQQQQQQQPHHFNQYFIRNPQQQHQNNAKQFRNNFGGKRSENNQRQKPRNNF